MQKRKADSLDKMIFSLSPIVFLGSLYIIIFSMVIKPSDLPPELIEVYRPFHQMSWACWITLVISGFMILAGGLPNWRSLAVASGIGVVGSASILIMVGVGIDFMTYLAFVFFVLIPFGKLVFEKASKT